MLPWPPCLRRSQDRVKGTDAEAHAAADALFLMNDKRLRRFLGSCDRFHRAVLLAQAAELARLGIHAVLDHGFAHTGRTAFFQDVRFVLASEILEGCENRVGRCLSKPAQGRGLNRPAHLFKKGEVFGFSSPSVISVKIWSRCWVPIRQGVHLPHDSFSVKLRKYRAMSTMHESSSMTIIPPEPMMEPTFASSS